MLFFPGSSSSSIYHQVFFIFIFVDYQPLTSNRGYENPDWAYGLGWAMAFSSTLLLLIWGICKICLVAGSLWWVGAGRESKREGGRDNRDRPKKKRRENEKDKE